jgi:2-methylcitrate dehydratase PrpD
LLIDGEIGPNQILEHRFADPVVRGLVDKIEVLLDPELDAHYKAGQETDLCMHSRVEIVMADGRRFDSGLIERGPEHWTWDDLTRKFRWLAGHVLPAPRVNNLVEVLRRFDELADVRELVSYL